MIPAVRSMIAATYVRSIGASRGFYELLGFREHSSGSAERAAWTVMQRGDVSILLAFTDPPLDIPALPLLFYFFFDDLDALTGALRAGRVRFTHTGHPPHALGGEVRVCDPDGNTVLAGQRERSPSQPQAAAEDPAPRFSLLREAAALVRARGGTTASCQIGNNDKTPCRKQAEVKLADTAGDTAWACLDHAGEVLMMVRGAFIANADSQGLTAFVARRRG